MPLKLMTTMKPWVRKDRIVELMEAEGLTFPEAVERLAKTIGLPQNGKRN